VVAPALIPRRAGDRVKTDRRDAARLARLHRAAELTAIRVPSPAEEAVRDLCRARADLVDDRRRARQRLKAFLLRHGRVYPEGSSWTLGHRRWLAAQRFGHPALNATYAQYRAVLAVREAELAAAEAELAPWCAAEPFTEVVCRLASYRGIADLSALTLGTEVVTGAASPPPRRSWASPAWSPASIPVGRPPAAGTSPRPATGLSAPCWWRPRTPTGTIPRSAPCWPAGKPAPVSRAAARSWAAQQRLCGRYRRMSARHKPTGVIVTAVARELAGFAWAEMTT
jgi:hypothetical protein